MDYSSFACLLLQPVTQQASAAPPIQCALTKPLEQRPSSNSSHHGGLLNSVHTIGLPLLLLLPLLLAVVQGIAPQSLDRPAERLAPSSMH